MTKMRRPTKKRTVPNMVSVF